MSNEKYGDKARLLSAECSETGPQCLQFWYCMYGSVGPMDLNVYLLQNYLDSIWQKNNNQGNMWHLAQVDFNTTQAFKVIHHTQTRTKKKEMKCICATQPLV